MQVLRVLGAVGVGAIVCFGFSERTVAAPELELDLTSITAQARNVANTANVAFSSSFTGSVVLGLDGNAALSALRVNGVSQPISGALTGLTGQINLAAGDVTGGSGTVTVTDSGTPRSYSFSIVPDLVDPGQTTFSPYDVFGSTSSGTFSSSSFAGFNVSPYAAQSPYTGDFDLGNYAPATSGPSVGFYNNADLDLVVELPEPTLAIAVAGCAGLGFLRRRRRV